MQHALRWLVLVVVLLTAVNGCTATDTSTGPERTVELSGGARLHIPAGALPGDAQVGGGAGSAPADIPTTLGFARSGAVDITVSVEPTAPVMVEIPVASSLYADIPAGFDDRAVLVLHKPVGAGWETLQGRLDRGRNVVSVETTSLSPLVAFLPSTAGLRKQVSDIVNGYLGSLDFHTDPPTCADEQKARNAGYEVRSTSTDVVRWCLGMNVAGGPELRVVLNRRYPLVATLGPGMTLGGTTDGEGSVEWAQRTTELLGRPGEVTLAPGGTTVISLAVASGATSRLHSEFDGFAQALVSLEVAYDAGREIASFARGGGKAARISELAELLKIPACADALKNVGEDPDDAQRIGTMIGACLHPEDFVESDAKVVLVTLGGVLGTLGGVVAYVLGSFDAGWDQFRGKADYDIAVRRGAGPCGAAAAKDSSGAALIPEYARAAQGILGAACNHDYQALANLMESPFIYGPNGQSGSPSAAVAAWKAASPSGKNLDALSKVMTVPPTLDQGGYTYRSGTTTVTFARLYQRHPWTMFISSAGSAPVPTSTTQGACPPSAVLEAAMATAQPGTKIIRMSDITCSGDWTSAVADLDDGSGYVNAYSALFKRSGSAWVYTPRDAPCAQGLVPASIRIVCESN